jgi:hypothetical protein
VEEPVFFTTARKDPDDPEHAIINRAALAVIFALAARPPTGNREVLMGAFTWVATGLEVPASRRDQAWLDFGMDREQAAELLKQRVYGTAT